jgi:ABC-type multidrug transport system fused ATPase/permease subunit
MPMPPSNSWSLLRHYLGARRGAALLMAALLLSSVAAQLAGPQIVRRFIDMAQADAPLTTLFGAAALYLGAAALQQLLRVLATYCSERVAWDATNQLRADLTSHLLSLDLGFHAGRTPGELIERVDGDVDALAGFFSAFAIEVVGSILLLAGVVAAVALLDWRLGLAFAALALFMPAVLARLRGAGVAHWHANREQSASYYGYIGELLGASEDLRSNAAEGYALRRLLMYLREWLPVARRAELWAMAVWIAAVLLFALADALAYGLGGGLFRSGAISLGAVYLLTAYAAMLAAPLETLRAQLQDLQQADAAAGRVRELLAQRSPLLDGAERLPAGALSVALEEVSFGYDTSDGRAAALSAMSFSLAPGQVLGLLGRTGSGKSTLARLLFRFYDPERGRVLLGGRDLRHCALADLRRRVALVTQDVQLFNATLRDNLTFFGGASDDARLLALLRELGLGDWLARQPGGLDAPIAPARLSSGEAQLIALARAFLSDPGLVVLDEPTARLDPATEALLERAMSRLLRGRTAIDIAHRLATVRSADAILILEQGRVAEYGSRAALLADGDSRYARLAALADRQHEPQLIERADS